ncbi:hypothetical protein SPRG_19426 [Saprolegnia parasitica CBS 223.65]|uniref:Uncharacterized protein n=1 Tax=Saprolegnia parasitica (strain CBS 223.65) TaxID=695850 RepID=A0A067CQ44_SAPPC|nr:hypothetical protein SPRG_19426 [Saprolegnia parasitica CBS 223.65]KDO32804.1 hypothetical protein SPRG_19426 [Saprolegnia parasitica CBS 223.65]|eukprot:XP_012196660.1 hypothetical protein SPRG_19426 [Saprolegnia parasitica CBS 223.65]
MPATTSTIAMRHSARLLHPAPVGQARRMAISAPRRMVLIAFSGTLVCRCTWRSPKASCTLPSALSGADPTSPGTARSFWHLRAVASILSSFSWTYERPSPSCVDASMSLMMALCSAPRSLH